MNSPRSARASTSGHAAANLDGADTLVVSSAIRPDNPELAEARRRGIRVLHRAAALGSAMLGRRGIAIAGTHGKTTTTSMLTTILRSCGADPSYVIGGILAETGLGAADGRGQDFIAEADESDGSFLMLSPQAAVVTCIEADHLDNYGSLAEIEATFLAFAARISAGGLLVACADDPGARALAAAAGDLPVRVRTYGAADGADYLLGDVTARGMATEATVTPGPRARVSVPGGIGVRIRVPGRHNALNAAAALAVAIELGYPPDQAAAGLAAYGGARRRMEPKGEADGVRVLDSYAHHPTELAADLTRRPGRGGRRPGHRGIPAAPVQPDPDLRGRVRRLARAGRRGGRARCVRGQGGSRARRDREADRRRRARRRAVPARPRRGPRGDRQPGQAG